MNALDLLKTDHRVVDMLFMQAQDAPPSKAEAIFTKIRNELEPHAHVEETIFYPKMKKEGNKELQKIILEGYEEHSQIKKFLFELAKMSAKSETFQPKLKVLVEDTRHHVKEEESEMFSLIEDQFSEEQLEKLGAQMQREKERYQKEHGIPPRSPEDETGSIGLLLESAKQAVTGLFGSSSKGSSKGGAKASGRSSAKSSKSGGGSSKSATKSASSKSTSSSGKSTGSGSRSSASSKSGSAKSSSASKSGSTKSAGNSKSASKARSRSNGSSKSASKAAKSGSSASSAKKSSGKTGGRASK